MAAHGRLRIVHRPVDGSILRLNQVAFGNDQVAAIPELNAKIGSYKLGAGDRKRIDIRGVDGIISVDELAILDVENHAAVGCDRSGSRILEG